MAQQTIRITLDEEIKKGLETLRQSNLYTGLKPTQLFKVALMSFAKKKVFTQIPQDGVLLTKKESQNIVNSLEDYDNGNYIALDTKEDVKHYIASL
jgi:hypothetical protein